MPQSIADRYAEIDPADLTTDQLLMWGLTTEVVGLRRDVLTERRGRRLSVAVISVAIVIVLIVLIVGSLVAANIREDRQREERQQARDAIATCETRKDASARIRAAVAAAVDESAKVLKADELTRLQLGEAVAARVLKEYPPPDC